MRQLLHVKEYHDPEPSLSFAGVTAQEEILSLLDDLPCVPPAADLTRTLSFFLNDSGA